MDTPTHWNAAALQSRFLPMDASCSIAHPSSIDLNHFGEVAIYSGAVEDGLDAVAYWPDAQPVLYRSAQGGKLSPTWLEHVRSSVLEGRGNALEKCGSALDGCGSATQPQQSVTRQPLSVLFRHSNVHGAIESEPLAALGESLAALLLTATYGT